MRWLSWLTVFKNPLRVYQCMFLTVIFLWGHILYIDRRYLAVTFTYVFFNIICYKCYILAYKYILTKMQRVNISPSLLLNMRVSVLYYRSLNFKYYNTDHCWNSPPVNVSLKYFLRIVNYFEIRLLIWKQIHTHVDKKHVIQWSLEHVQLVSLWSIIYINRPV